MKNLKIVFITFAFIAVLSSQQSALAMHQEMTAQERLAFFDSRLAEAMGEGKYAEAHKLIEECGADITALSQADQDEYANYESALANEPQLTEAMDAKDYAKAHRLIENGADITALPQMYQLAYEGYLVALANKRQDAEHVAHITPHPPVAAPAAEAKAGEEEEEEEKENAAPQQKGKSGSRMCTIS